MGASTTDFLLTLTHSRGSAGSPCQSRCPKPRGANNTPRKGTPLCAQGVCWEGLQLGAQLLAPGEASLWTKGPATKTHPASHVREALTERQGEARLWGDLGSGLRLPLRTPHGRNLPQSQRRGRQCKLGAAPSRESTLCPPAHGGGGSGTLVRPPAGGPHCTGPQLPRVWALRGVGMGGPGCSQGSEPRFPGPQETGDIGATARREGGVGAWGGAQGSTAGRVP